MAQEVQEVCDRGYNASYNEFNPYPRGGKLYIWFQAGYFDAWGQMPKSTHPTT